MDHQDEPISTNLDALYRARFKLYDRFKRQKIDSAEYMKALASLDAAVDRLEMSVLRGCPIFRKELSTPPHSKEP